MENEACRRAFHFVVETKHRERRRGLFNFPRSFRLSCMRVKFKLLISAIRQARNFKRYWEPRFNSSFKMTDSAISFMDLRICWLCRCRAR